MDYFQTLAEVQVEAAMQYGKDGIADIIDSLGPFHIDDLREIAIRLLPQDKLPGFLTMSGIDLRKPQSELEGRVNALKTTLLAHC